MSWISGKKRSEPGVEGADLVALEDLVDVDDVALVEQKFSHQPVVTFVVEVRAQRNRR
jgi:hypothetical protein